MAQLGSAGALGAPFPTSPTTAAKGFASRTHRKRAIPELSTSGHCYPWQRSSAAFEKACKLAVRHVLASPPPSRRDSWQPGLPPWGQVRQSKLGDHQKVTGSWSRSSPGGSPEQTTQRSQTEGRTLCPSLFVMTTKLSPAKSSGPALNSSAHTSAICCEFDFSGSPRIGKTKFGELLVKIGIMEPSTAAINPSEGENKNPTSLHDAAKRAADLSTDFWNRHAAEITMKPWNKKVRDISGAEK